MWGKMRHSSREAGPQAEGREEESWEHLSVMRQRGVGEPREIKWGLSHEGKFFSMSSLHPSRCRLCVPPPPRHCRFLSTRA